MSDDLIEKVRVIVDIVKTNHLKSISVNEGGFSCQIETREESKKAYHADDMNSQESTKSITNPGENEDHFLYIKAPLVGTFYRSSSPANDPYVEVGDLVEPRQTLCIIEAMKVMNEIASEVKGRVVDIYPENGQIVDFNHLLFKIEPDQEAA